MKLSKTQEKALEQLTDNWQSAPRGVSLATLNALVTKGVADHKTELGAMFFPRTGNQYRRKR